jgi:hypothetical protein
MLKRVVAFEDTPLGVKGTILVMECGHKRHFFEYVRNARVCDCEKCKKEVAS